MGKDVRDTQEYRIVFMGTPSFAIPSLQNLVEKHRIVGVVTQPDRPSGRGKKLQESPVKQSANELGLPIIQPVSLKNVTVTKQIEEWRPTIIVVVAYGQLLPRSLLDLPPCGCVNVHASLLPKWRGAAPIPAAILAGDHETGISIMKMDLGLDTGPVYRQSIHPMNQLTTSRSLFQSLSELGAELLANILPDVISGTLQPKEQDHELATYAPQIRKSDGEIDWRKPAILIERQLRAYDPWPGSFSKWSDKRLIFHGGRVEEGNWEPGYVDFWGDSLAIGCGEGVLLPEKLQLAGKRVRNTEEFVRGNPNIVGAQLDYDQF